MTSPRSTSLRRWAGAWNPLTPALFAGLWIGSVGNWPLWWTLMRLPEMATPRGALFIVAFGLIVATLSNGLLALAAWPRAIKPVIAIFLLSAAIGAHFMGAYGIVLDPTMMINVIQTNPREVGDLLSPQLIANLALIAVAPLLWLWRAPMRATALPAQALRNGLGFLGCALLLTALIAIFFEDMSSTMRNHRSLRYLINPVNAYFSLGVIAKQASAREAGPLLTIGSGARLQARAPGALAPLLVLVIGETARADHFQLNGYTRPTNPELAREDVVSFGNVTSCGTNTAASLPCMFSALGRTAFGARECDQENLLDLARGSTINPDARACATALCMPKRSMRRPVPARHRPDCAQAGSAWTRRFSPISTRGSPRCRPRRASAAC